MKRCSTCKIEKERVEFHKDAPRKDGLQPKCRACVSEYYQQNKDHYKKKRARYYQLNREQYADRSRKHHRKAFQTPRGKFRAYKSSAKWRGLDFHLSPKQFQTFWQNPCSYCGSEIATIGIDRVDNDKGYELSNCVSCCETCNTSKNALPLEVWQQTDYFQTICLRFLNDGVPADSLDPETMKDPPEIEEYYRNLKTG